MPRHARIGTEYLKEPADKIFAVRLKLSWASRVEEQARLCRRSPSAQIRRYIERCLAADEAAQATRKAAEA